MTIKVVPYEAPNGYSDTYVKSDKMMFSFLSPDNKMVGPLVNCKDYLQNRIQGFLLGKPGYKEYHYLPGKMADIDLERTRLIVCRQTSSEEMEYEMSKAMSLLNPLEKDLGLKKSKFELLAGVKKEYGVAYVITGSKRWMLAPPMINLLAFLMRNAHNHRKSFHYLESIEKFEDDELAVGSQLQHIKEAVRFIVNNKYWKVFGKDMTDNYAEQYLPRMHKCGILAYSTNKLDDLVPASSVWKHWLYPSVVQKAA